MNDYVARACFVGKKPETGDEWRVSMVFGENGVPNVVLEHIPSCPPDLGISAKEDLGVEASPR